MKNEYMYVMDYGYPGIYEIALGEEDVNKDIDVILEEHGLNIDNVTYMFTTRRIDTIEIITKMGNIDESD